VKNQNIIKELINQFRKRKYIILMNLKNSNNYIEYIFNIKNKEIIKLLNYDKKFLFDKNEEIGEYFDIYIDNKKINFLYSI
jgi:hypothetical protein